MKTAKQILKYCKERQEAARLHNAKLRSYDYELYDSAEDVLDGVIEFIEDT